MNIQNSSTCFFYTKKNTGFISKNLCTYLIKQSNNHSVKQWKQNSSTINKNKIESENKDQDI